MSARPGTAKGATVKGATSTRRPVTGRGKLSTTRKSSSAISGSKGPVQEASHGPASPGALSSDSFTVSNRFEGNSRCIAVSSDGTAWTGEVDGSIVIRMAPLGYEVSRIAAYGRSIANVLLNVDGKMWAGYSDGSIRVFHPSSLKVLFESNKHTAAIYAICAKNGYVYTGGADWKVYRWECEDYHFDRLLYGHRNTVRCLTSYTDADTGADRIVSGSDDGTVRVWDPAETGKDQGCVAVLEGHERPVLSATVLGDTAELWTGCEDGSIRVWDLYSLTCTAVIEAHKAPVVTLKQVEDTMWTGAKNGTIVIIDRLTKEVVHQTTQPPTAIGMTQRFAMVIQPVQRSIVYNVWATNADGKWQCWSCLYPESPSMASAFDLSPEAQLVHMSKSAAKKGKKVPGGDVELSPEDAAREQARAGKDNELRENVANLRYAVHDTIMAEAEAAAVAEDGAANGDDDDASEDSDDVPLDKVERSIRRDHIEAMEKEKQKAAGGPKLAAYRQTPLSAQEAAKAAEERRQLEQALRRSEAEREAAKAEVERMKKEQAKGPAPEDQARMAALEDELRKAQKKVATNREEMQNLGQDLATTSEENKRLAAELEDMKRQYQEMQQLATQTALVAAQSEALHAQAEQQDMEEEEMEEEQEMLPSDADAESDQDIDFKEDGEAPKAQ